MLMKIMEKRGNIRCCKRKQRLDSVMTLSGIESRASWTETVGLGRQHNSSVMITRKKATLMTQMQGDG